MTDRASLSRTLVEQAGWGDAQSSLLAGDASNRKYHRLTRPGTKETAVLMDAAPDRGEDVRPFMQIAGHLAGQGLSAPRILAADENQGFLLLEDLGDALFARAIPADPDLEFTLYAAATDLLAQLHTREPPPGLASYTPEVMTDLAALAFDWYSEPDQAGRQTLEQAMKEGLARHAAHSDVLILRDYHAENLLWLPQRKGTARVGLLDFQDAMMGHRAYDLVSLLQDARRDVPPGIEAAMIDRYITATDADPDSFQTAYRWLGVQRNLRILGVFARLCIRDGKPGYIDLIPRVWAHLQADLAHPSLIEIRNLLGRSLPAPTPDALSILKDKCAIAPAQ